MKRLMPHLLFIVIFIAQSSAGIAMATQMQLSFPAQGSVEHLSVQPITALTTDTTHCQQHALQSDTTATACQHCTQNDCSHCHCMSSFSGMTFYLPFVAADSDVPHYTGFALPTVPDTPPQRILRPPRFIA